MYRFATIVDRESIFDEQIDENHSELFKSIDVEIRG